MYVWVRREIYTTHTHTYIYHAVDFIVFVSQILQYVKIFDVFFFYFWDTFESTALL